MVPVAAAAAITGLPCRVKGPAQAMTQAAGSSSERRAPSSSRETAAIGGGFGNAAASASSFSRERPAITKSAPRSESSAAISLPVKPVAP